MKFKENPRLKRFSEGKKRQAVTYSLKHGPKAAADKFETSTASIRNWQIEQKKRKPTACDSRTYPRKPVKPVKGKVSKKVKKSSPVKAAKAAKGKARSNILKFRKPSKNKAKSARSKRVKLSKAA